MQRRIQLNIYGRVQGVAYRANTRQKANQLGLSGFVENRPDGSVYAEAQGTEEQLKKLTDWCHQGPPLALVQRVETNELPVVSVEESFRIRR